jgi:hypothetical protein
LTLQEHGDDVAGGPFSGQQIAQASLLDLVPVALDERDRYGFILICH